jgi:hypothetical protein
VTVAETQLSTAQHSAAQHMLVGEWARARGELRLAYKHLGGYDTITDRELGSCTYGRPIGGIFSLTRKIAREPFVLRTILNPQINIK